MNILISAYAVNPNSGSEPGLGWNWVIELAKYNNIYVLTESEFRDNIERELRNIDHSDNIHFIFIQIGEVARSMCWNQGDWRFYFHYRRWQLRAYNEALNLTKNIRIDVIHQLNMIGFREPGFLWKIENIPFIWGPVGGFCFIPVAYMKNFSVRNKLFYLIKNLLNFSQALFSFRVRAAAKRARYIFAASAETYNALQKFYGIHSIRLNETGCHFPNYVQSERVVIKDTFDVLWVGRFIPTKMLDLAIEVIAKSADISGIRFHIVGSSGSSYFDASYKSLAKKFGVDSLCSWYGTIPFGEVQNLMKKSDLLLFTSIVEGTPHVVLEAISNSLQVLCFDICGQGEVITEGFGYKVPLETYGKSVIKFSTILKSLSEDKLKKANKIPHKLSWGEKAVVASSFYESAANNA